MAEESIALNTRSCNTAFSKLDRVCSENQEYVCQLEISPTAVADEQTRFKIWAGNSGALQEAQVKSSLAWRLREAPKIARQIQEILSDLLEGLEDAYSIVSGERPNHTEAPDDEATDLGSDRKTSESQSEIKEIFLLIHDSIAALFRLSVVIQNATPRDRFAKAQVSASSDPFDDRFDVSHVGHKFPALEKPELLWLKQRLGKAISQRRQYLRYARDHRQKKSKDLSEDAQVPPEGIWQPSSESRTDAQPQETNTIDQSSKRQSTMERTTASTLIVAQLNEDANLSDTGLTETSFATSMGEDDIDKALEVAQLNDVCRGQSSFECPYCWAIQSIKRQRSWKKHVYQDLRPYMCTFKECDMKLFPDRRSWTEHEFHTHRLHWQCSFCTRAPFSDSKSLQSHLVKHHATSASAEALQTIAQAGARPQDKLSPQDCLFCGDEWHQSLRAANPALSSSGQELVVTPAQFSKHVGAHMEQLALFAIPRGREEAGEGGSADVAAGSQSNTEDGMVLGGAYDGASDVDDEADPLLIFLAKENLVEDLQHLLDEGMDPNVTGLLSRTALHAAASKGRVGVVRMLLGYDANVNQADSMGLTALYFAADNDEDYSVTIKLLLESGASPDSFDTSGQTPLHRASEKGNTTCAALLLKHGADPNIRDAQGYQPLHQAIISCHPLIARILLEHGADVNAQISETDMVKPLHLVASNSKAFIGELAQLVLSSGSNVDDVMHTKDTALHIAAKNHNVAVAKHLLESGANPLLVNELGQNPLHCAIDRSDVEIAQMIIDRVSLDKMQLPPWNYLHRAITRRNSEMVRILLEKGIGVNDLDTFGHTPLFRATQEGNDQLIDLLKSRGGKINNFAIDEQSAHLPVGNPYRSNINSIMKSGYRGPGEHRDSINIAVSPRTPKENLDEIGDQFSTSWNSFRNSSASNVVPVRVNTPIDIQQPRALQKGGPSTLTQQLEQQNDTLDHVDRYFELMNFTTNPNKAKALKTMMYAILNRTPKPRRGPNGKIYSIKDVAWYFLKIIRVCKSCNRILDHPNRQAAMSKAWKEISHRKDWPQVVQTRSKSRPLQVDASSAASDVTPANLVPRRHMSGIAVSVLILGEQIVVRRVSDSLVNATQILNAAGVKGDERSDVLESLMVEGPYEIITSRGSLYGIWISPARARPLCQQWNMLEQLRPLLDLDIDRAHKLALGHSHQCPDLECSMYFSSKSDMLKHCREAHGIRESLDGPLEEYCCPVKACERHSRGFLRLRDTSLHYQQLHGGELPGLQDPEQEHPLSDELVASKPFFLGFVLRPPVPKPGVAIDWQHVLVDIMGEGDQQVLSDMVQREINRGHDPENFYFTNDANNWKRRHVEKLLGRQMARQRNPRYIWKVAMIKFTATQVYGKMTTNAMRLILRRELVSTPRDESAMSETLKMTAGLDHVDEPKPLPMRASFDYAIDETGFSFRKGDIIQVISRSDSGWCEGIHAGRRGVFPSSYGVFVPSQSDGTSSEINQKQSARIQSAPFILDQWDQDQAPVRGDPISNPRDYLQISREYISTVFLSMRGIPWQLDGANREFIVVKETIPTDVLDVMRKQTRDLQQLNAQVKNSAELRLMQNRVGAEAEIAGRKKELEDLRTIMRTHKAEIDVARGREDKIGSYDLPTSNEDPASLSGYGALRRDYSRKLFIEPKPGNNKPDWYREAYEGTSLFQELYRRSARKDDGYFYCPLLGDECDHAPFSSILGYRSHLDDHFKPYRCKVSRCSERFATTIGRRNHERKFHQLHDDTENLLPCIHNSCERASRGNGFMDVRSFLDHLKAVHDFQGEPTDEFLVVDQSSSRRDNLDSSPQTFDGKNTPTCNNCQERDLRCDGRKPWCSTCLRTDKACNYNSIEKVAPVPLQNIANNTSTEGIVSQITRDVIQQLNKAYPENISTNTTATFKTTQDAIREPLIQADLSDVDPEFVAQITQNVVEQLQSTTLEDSKSAVSFDGPPCNNCRERSIECNRAKPACFNCEGWGNECVYPTEVPTISDDQLGGKQLDRSDSRNMKLVDIASQTITQLGKASCDLCRLYQSDCQGQRPTCERCSRRGWTCTYIDEILTPQFRDDMVRAVLDGREEGLLARVDVELHKLYTDLGAEEVLERIRADIGVLSQGTSAAGVGATAPEAETGPTSREMRQAMLGSELTSVLRKNLKWARDNQ